MLDAITDQDGDVIAPTYSQRQQSIRQPIDPCVQLAIGNLTETVSGGNLVWEIRSAAAQAIAHQ
jgi:hypothetical protein